MRASWMKQDVRPALGGKGKGRGKSEEPSTDEQGSSSLEPLWKGKGRALTPESAADEELPSSVGWEIVGFSTIVP